MQTKEAVKMGCTVWLLLTIIPVLMISIWWLFIVDISQPTPTERYTKPTNPSITQER